jgi:Ca2+-binding RTX toxin-like protein
VRAARAGSVVETTEPTNVSRRRVASIAVLTAALGMLALPGIAQAGELTYSAGVLTYTGGDAVDNNVSATHQGDPAEVRIVDAADSISIGSGTGCAPDDIDFGVICPAPGKLVVNLGGGDDFFTDDTALGDPLAFPVAVNGGAGNDEFDGGGGADALTGGPGDDNVLGDGGSDVLQGDDGADTLDGGADHDQLDGGIGKDRLTGGAGNDIVRGGDGDDELDYSPLYAFDGTDIFEGGTGYDKVGYFGRSASVSVSLDAQPNDGQAGEGDNIGADVEEVDGGDAADVLVGSAGPNWLAGRGGDDQISGGGGGDVLYGDSGNDQIDGGDGNDTLDGGCHDDTIIGGPGVDSLNSDGTCADPALRGLNDVLHARDGVKDSLVLCTMSGTAGDTAIVDPADPALGPGNPGACRTIDAAAPGTVTPGDTSTTTTPGDTTTLIGKLRARLGSTVRLLAGTGGSGHAVRQRANLKAKPPRLTLGSLLATTASQVKATATFRSRGRTITLGTTAITVKPSSPRTLSIKLSKKGKAALRRVKKARIKVRFTVYRPTTRNVLHRSTQTFRVAVRR